MTPITRIKQIGIVTDDLQRTMANFERYGIGGWETVYEFDAQDMYSKMTVHDQPQFYNIKSVVTNALNIELELIEPLDDLSDYADFLKKNGKPGIHHICVETDDIEAVKGLGKSVVLQGELKEPPLSYVYYDFQDELGMILEYFPVQF